MHTLKITLRRVRPPVWRRITVPSDLKLAALAPVLEAAMGWYGDHLHAFEAGGKRYGEPDPDWGAAGRRGGVPAGRCGGPVACVVAPAGGEDGGDRRPTPHRQHVAAAVHRPRRPGLIIHGSVPLLVCVGTASNAPARPPTCSAARDRSRCGASVRPATAPPRWRCR
ncbi:MAG: IS1096 element passenger TnpR family protein [Ilumatobacteraceae bacterium]